LISQGNQLTSDPWTVVALQPDGTGAQTLTPGLQPNWQPGHAKFAFTTTDGTAWIANGDDSERRALPTPPGAHWEQASLSQDGSRVIGPCGSAALCLTSVDGAATRVINFMPYFLYPKTTTWSPDGHRVAFQYDDVGYPTNIAVINVDDAAPWPQDLPLNQTKSWSDGAYRSPAWSPDGTSIAFVRTVDQITTRPSTVEVLDLASGTVKVWAALNGEPSDLYGFVNFHSVAWSPDGRALVAVREGLDDLVIIQQDGTTFNVPGIHGARSVSWF
jgi:Tol biopolymer transport system component